MMLLATTQLHPWSIDAAWSCHTAALRHQRQCFQRLQAGNRRLLLLQAMHTQFTRPHYLLATVSFSFGIRPSIKRGLTLISSCYTQICQSKAERINQRKRLKMQFTAAWRASRRCSPRIYVMLES